MDEFRIIIQRFVLNKMTAADGDKYFRLSNNPAVMKFVTGYALNREESDEMLQGFLIENRSNTFFGRYLIEDIQTGELIGAAKLDKFGSEIEIGYRIQEEHWGRGVATEIARGLIDFSRNHLQAKKVIAFVNVNNKASIRVLEKAGMENVETIEDIDEVKYKFSFSPRTDSVLKKLLNVVFGLK